MHRQPPVGFRGEVQHCVRKTVEQSTHPAPSKVGGGGSLGGPCVETAVLVFLAAAARAGVVAARFHLPASRIGFGSAVTRWPGRPRRACVVSRAKSRSARLARASCRSNGGCAGSTVLFLAVYGLLHRSSKRPRPSSTLPKCECGPTAVTAGLGGAADSCCGAGVGHVMTPGVIAKKSPGHVVLPEP